MRSVLRWLLAAVACLVAALTGLLGFHILCPVSIQSPPGLLALRALAFPLHLLLPAIACFLLMLFAWRLRAAVATGCLAVVTLLLLALALWPSAAMWEVAGTQDFPLSLQTY